MGISRMRIALHPTAWPGRTVGCRLKSRVPVYCASVIDQGEWSFREGVADSSVESVTLQSHVELLCENALQKILIKFGSAGDELGKCILTMKSR